jgi:hypothetical protein
MKRKILTGLLLGIACASFFTATAQTDSVKSYPTYRVGIFAPLYLDSVFTNNNFRYNDAVPKFIMPSVDFVQGAQIALDSMQPGKENIKAAIYDSKSYAQPINTLIKNKKLDSLDLIIGSVKDVDYKQLADFALLKNIPFISVTYPNDGGVTGNPFTVILNSTLKAHCEAIYSYLLQNHGTDLIFLCRKKGSQEDKVAAYFKALNEQDGKPLLNIQTLSTDSSFTSAVLKNKLDSNRHSVVIGGSLDESFASSLAAACFGLFQIYPANSITLIGMPNWDAFTSLHKKDDLQDFPIYFTSPYFNNKWDNYSKMLTAAYAKKFKTKPSDMAFKGFESVYMFTKLLTKFPDDLINHLNDKSVKIFCDYNIKPVMLKKENTTPDYLENKHLYFVKLMNGGISKAW